MTINYKWLTYNCVTLFVIIFAIQFYDGWNLLLELDKTRVTLLILGIYAACSAYLGIKGENANFEAVNYHAGRLTALGLIGTVMAIMMMLFGVQDVAQFRQNIMAEIAPVFITALFGLGGSYLLSNQIALCFGRYNSE